MLFAGVRKGTDALLDDAFAPRLRLGRRRFAFRFAFGNVFVCRPTSHIAQRAQLIPISNTVTRSSSMIRPRSQSNSALQAFPAAFVRGATRIGYKPFLGGRQARHHKPRDCPKPLA